MAKMFYSAEEAAEKLGKSESQLEDLVRAGDIREFRDAGRVNYKVEEIDALAPVGESAASAESSAEIILEPVEESGIELAASGSDILSLEDGEPDEAEDTAAGTRPGREKKKGDTAVPSVGINVFDDDELDALDEAVDPLAQTAVSDIAGLGMDGSGSGSGILKITEESDDTSLGAELLDEIYTGGGEGVEMGDATRAGLEGVTSEEAAPEEEAAVDQDVAGPDVEIAAAGPQAVVQQVIEYGPDAVSTSLTALMIVAIVVMWFGGLAAAALVRGIVPGMLETIYANLGIYSGGALGVAAMAGAVTYFVAKRSA